MTFSFFSFLKSIFRPMSASVALKSDSVQQRSSPPSVFLPLGSLGLDISEYMRLLKDKALLTQDGRDELSKHIVTKLEHMKANSDAQHEYVIATVKYNDSEIRLSIERTRGAELPKDYQSQKSPVKFPSSDSFTIASMPNSSQDSLFKPTMAKDMVKYMGQQPYPQPSRVLVTFIPHPGIVNLLQLAAIIQAVHDLEERYALLRAQCYWFAMLVMGAAMARGGQVRYSERGKDEAGDLPTVASTSDLSHIPVSPPPDEMGQLVKGPDAKGVGKYHWARVVAVSPKDIQIIAVEAERRYKDALEESETKYASIAQVHQGDAAKIIEELKEEGKKKDEEVRRKDDEVRMKDDEVRKKDEELRKKDELIRQLLSQPQAESSQH